MAGPVGFGEAAEVGGERPRIESDGQPDAVGQVFERARHGGDAMAGGPAWKDGVPLGEDGGL